VTAAKKIVAQDANGAAMDLPAEQSEVMNIANESARPAFVAADTLAQAEHSVDAQVGLVTISPKGAEARVAEEGKPQPIIELSLRGQLGFPNSLLELQKIRDEVREMTGALHVRIKNHTVPVDYAETSDDIDDAGRERLERRVIDDLVLRDNRYKTRSIDISDAVIGAKRMALGDEPAEKIVEFIGMKLSEPPA